MEGLKEGRKEGKTGGARKEGKKGGRRKRRKKE